MSFWRETLSRDDDDGNESWTQKLVAFSEKVRDGFYQFSLCNLPELSRSLLRRGGIKVEKEKGKLVIMRSRSP